MALRVSFKPGAAQSLEAAHYFRSTAGSLVEDWIDSMEGRLYTMDAGNGASMHLRIWSATEFGEEELHHLLVWLAIVREDIGKLHDGTWQQGRLPHMVANWLAMRHGGAGFFVEQSVVRPGAETEEAPDLSIGVMGGRTVMVSTNTLMFVRLQDGVFGLTMAGHGSYLLEDVDRDGSATGAFRRAS